MKAEAPMAAAHEKAPRPLPGCSPGPPEASTRTNAANVYGWHGMLWPQASP